MQFFLFFYYEIVKMIFFKWKQTHKGSSGGVLRTLRTTWSHSSTSLPNDIPPLSPRRPNTIQRRFTQYRRCTQAELATGTSGNFPVSRGIIEFGDSGKVTCRSEQPSRLLRHNVRLSDSVKP